MNQKLEYTYKETTIKGGFGVSKNLCTPKDKVKVVKVTIVKNKVL